VARLLMWKFNIWMTNCRMFRLYEHDTKLLLHIS